MFEDHRFLEKGFLLITNVRLDQEWAKSGLRLGYMMAQLNLIKVNPSLRPFPIEPVNVEMSPSVSQLDRTSNRDQTGCPVTM